MTASGPTPSRWHFRFRLRHIRETLRRRTKECLDYELSGAELLFEPSSGGAMESAKVAMLQAQRDTLRRLLDALNGAVAELRGSYDSRMTNLTNLMILVLTLASIFLAFRSLKVAQVTSVVDDLGQRATSDVAVSIDKPTSSRADLKP